jgi:hypothetical protein
MQRSQDPQVVRVLVEAEDFPPADRAQMSDQILANEAGSTGDENPL